MDETARVAIVQQILDELVATERIVGCAAITVDGFVVAVAAGPAFISQVGDVGARLHAVSQRASVTLELGEVAEHVVVGEHGTVMIRPLDRREMIVVVAAAGAPLGWVRVFSEKASVKLRDAGATGTVVGGEP